MSSDCTIQFSHNNCVYRVKDLALKDEKVKHNLTKLFEREKGTLFRVDNGKLVEVVGWMDWLSYRWNLKAEEEKVRSVIDQTLNYFDGLLLRVEKKNAPIARLAARVLFSKTSFKGIGRLSKALYNEELLKSGNTLSKYLTPADTIRLQFGGKRYLDLTSSKFEGKDFPFLLDMDLGDPVANHNFWMLLKREKGQLYQVDHTGMLVEQARCCYCCNKTENEKKVQAAVEGVLQQLNAYCSKVKGSEVHHLVMEKIFYPGSPFSNLNRRILQRAKLNEDSDLIAVLSPSYRRHKQEHADALKEIRDAPTEATKEAAMHRLERALIELTDSMALISQRFGIELKRIGDGGSGGARVAYDLYGNKILVVKPGDEGPYGVNNPSKFAWLKRLILSGRACLLENSEPMAEVDSWLWDRNFGVWSVPPTYIRYVYSSDFVGTHYKECSLQMFVANNDGTNCETLGQYVGVSPKIHWYPRGFLRWYCGSKSDLGLFGLLGHRERRSEELLNKLPVNLMEKAALHDMGTENIDCHFENILVKVSNVPAEKTLMDRIFEGDRTITDEAIDAYMNQFFHKKKHQEILDHLLASERVVVGGKEQKVTLVKHDGGSSNPSKHPSSYDYLSLRFKHLFEVLPHFEEPFSEEAQELFINKDEQFALFLLEKASRNFKNIMNSDVYDEFWNKKSINRSNFKKWVFERHPATKSDLKRQLVNACYKAFLKVETEEIERKIRKKRKNLTENEYIYLVDAKVAKFIAREEKKNLYYFNYHLERIEGNLETRVDSFRVLKKFLNAPNRRDLFKNVKNRKDFERELGNREAIFEETMTKYATRPVAPGAIKQIPDRAASLYGSVILQQLGEHSE